MILEDFVVGQVESSSDDGQLGGQQRYDSKSRRHSEDVGPFEGDHGKVQRVEYFRVYNPEKLMMRKQRDPPDCHQICMIYIHILPLTHILILSQSG